MHYLVDKLCNHPGGLCNHPGGLCNDPGGLCNHLAGFYSPPGESSYFAVTTG